MRTEAFKNINWSVVEDKYLEKTQEFIKTLENGTNNVIYVEEEGGTGYYDLVAVEVDGKYNAIPLPILLKMFNLDEDADIYDLMGLLEQSFAHMTRNEYDSMLQQEKIRKETDKFFRLHEIVEILKNGETLVLETAENQYGEKVSTRILYLNDEGLFEEGYLNCWSSSDYGFGTCRCCSHKAFEYQVISPESALVLIREYIEREEKEEKEKQRQLAKIDFVLAELAKM